ncbi:MAG: transglutaminase family protein [Planctomycetales bacterium]
MRPDLQLARIWDDLKLAPPTEAEYDLAEWNLRLAQNLPGSENLDISRLLDKLDGWVERVRRDTERLYYRFLADPADYQFSQGYFCVLVLITVLERDLGVRYNPDRVKDPKFQDPHCVDPDFSDSRDLFIHGILDGPGGTCSSMPVLYTSVGRRLGYPMKLVAAPEHLFSRWDDPQGKFNGVPDVFNIDASGHGFANPPDEHYREWPREWTEEERRQDWYLRSFSPTDEFASFLTKRATCLEDNGRRDEAFLCFHWAYQLTQDKRYYWNAARLQRRLETDHRRRLEFLEELEQQRQRRRRELGRSQEPAVIRWAPQYPAPLAIRDVGHGPSCRCANCLRDRPAALAKCDFGHGPSCQCFHCTENRKVASRSPSHGTPGIFGTWPT